MKNNLTANKVIMCLFTAILFFSFFSNPVLSQEKRVRVIAEKANIHLRPDKRSLVIETVDKGTILTLRQTRRVKKLWDYVYFTSEKTGISKSGYILDSLVEKLFGGIKAVTLDEGKDKSILHFRQAFWGVNKEHVLKLEGKPSSQEFMDGLEIVGYQQKVAGMKCKIEYIFKEDKLIRAKYVFLEQRKYDNQYIADYKIVKDFITKNSELPSVDNINWLNSLYKEDYSKWGLAISLGHLEYVSLWSTPETDIMLKLYGENNKILIEVEYSGIKFKDVENG